MREKRETDRAASRTPKRRRGVLAWAAWGVAGLLTAAAAAVLAFALACPDPWKAHTARNAFEARSVGGVFEPMAWETPRLLEGPVNDEPYNLSSSISVDGKTMIFCRRTGGGDADLFISRRQGGRWARPKPLELLNTDANETTPELTADGRQLIYASDRPDGMGGYDLWVTMLTEDGWTEPANLGPKVNSEFNERGGCLGPAGKRLYFSSDRPKREMAAADRRMYWEALTGGYQQGDYDIFVVDGVVLPNNPNPLRDKLYRETVIVDLGGSPETERAVQSALDWLASTQESNGRWDSAKQGGQRGQDVAATALAALCYLGWGARHDREGPYQQTMKKSLDWLVAEGKKCKGDYSKRIHNGMYGHGAATIALAEAYQVTKDPNLLEVLTKAVDVIVKSQDPKLGGWRYSAKPQKGDTSMIGWQVLALRSAKLAGVHAPQESFDLAGRWMDYVAGGKERGLYGYQNAKPTEPMTAEGMFVQQLLGASPPEERQKESARYLAENVPTRKSNANLYYWYYGCLALYQHQGPEWTTWNDAIKPLLLERQIKSGPNTGTWEPGRWREAGRTVATALATLSLEVYYRYLPMYNVQWQGKAAEPVKKTTRQTVRQFVPATMPAPRKVSHTTPMTAQWVEALTSPFTEGSPTFGGRGDWVYFSSDREGGYGGFDVYRSAVIGGVIQRPENVGDPINSPDHELSPELAAGGFEMVFSSDRPHESRKAPLLYHTSLTPISSIQKALASLDRVKWWLLGLLLGLIALICLLVWYLRAENRERLSLLAQCLAGSAGVHALALVLLSLYMLTVAIQESAGDPMEIRIDADALASEKLALEIREQVSDVAATPEFARVVSDHEPMPLPEMPSAEPSPWAQTRQDLKVSPARLEVRAPEIPTNEPPPRPAPATAQPRRVRFDTDVALELKPVVADARPAKAEPVPTPAPVAAGRPEATMSDVADEAMREQAAPADGQTVAVAKALDQINTQWISDTAEASPGPSPPRPIRLGGPKLGEMAVELETRQTPAELGGTSAPEASAEFGMADATATMAGQPAGEAMGGASDPLQGRPIFQQVRPGQLAMDIPREELGMPQLKGPGDLVTRKTPRLELADVTDLEAPAEMKSNYAARQTEHRKDVARRGGSDETEEAIGRALDWLTRHQESDGRWDCEKHDGANGHNIAATGLAMLCYYGWNARHDQEGPYREQVAKALQWMLKQMGPNGDLTGGQKNGMYDQGIATIALAEAYGLSRDGALREPVRRAVEFIGRAQSTEHGGWRYRPESKDGDTSVVGWQVMALTCARMAGVRVPQEPFHRAARWLDRVSSGPHRGRYGYTDSKGASEAMTAEAMFCQQLMGLRPEDPRMEASADYLKMALPNKRSVNYYYWYYGCLAMYQHQGPVWELWNEQMKAVFLSTQTRGGSQAGSWPAGGKWTGKNGGGRVMSTAMSTLSLEVYYRYLPLYQRRADIPAKKPGATVE